MRPRSFRVRPADDDEFLPVQPFGLAPQAAVSRYITRLDRLRDNALKTEFPGVLEDELAVASLMAVELNARLACDQRLKKRLALDKRQARDVPAVKMQEIEGVIDGPTWRSPSVAAWVLAKLGSPDSPTPQSSPSM